MSAPIGNTCPDIDRLLKTIKSLRRELKSVPDEIEEVGKIFRDIDYELDCIADSLEDLRSDNNTLREWGKQMEQEAESLQVQIDEMLSEINK